MKLHNAIYRLRRTLGYREGVLAKRRAEQARRDYNVWAWEQNRRGRQVRLGSVR